MMNGTTTGLGVAMPEWLARRDVQNGAWEVQRGEAKRGEAWTNQRDRVMRVPFGGDETNRVIRAHEMTHARVSPVNAVLGMELGFSEGSIRAAEEFRVNSLVRVAGFDIDMLVDGSENIAGQRLAQMNDIEGMVQSIAAMANTKGAAAFLRGVKTVDEDLSKALREVEKAVIKTWAKPARRSGDNAVAKKFGSTRPCTSEGWENYNAGYRDFTIPLAKMLDSIIDALTPDPEDEGDEENGDANEENKNENEAKKPKDRVGDAISGRHGRWGNLIFDREVRLTKTMYGSLGRKRVATNVGRNPRRMNRMLTDPQRRIFDRTVRGIGGVVLIDQSGSMALSVEDVEKMMEASPGCTIIGYSHRARSTDVPNIWVLAENGRRVAEVRKGSGGNGVDGPAVRYAVAQARRGEPIVWVCDGCVTSGDDDKIYENLDIECAKLVVKNRIYMAEDVKTGIEALHRVAKREKLPTRMVGNVKSRAYRAGIRVK